MGRPGLDDTRSRVAAVWFPSHPLCGAAVATHLAAVAGAPSTLIDLDPEWSDVAAILLDGPAPRAEAAIDEVLASTTEGAAGIRMVATSRLDPELVVLLRGAGGGVVHLPCRLGAAPVAAEADVLVLGVARGFASLRRARLALDALPPARGELLPVLIHDGPSDLARRDVESVLGCRVEAELEASAREVALAFERGDVAAAAASAKGGFGAAVAGVAARIWPHIPPIDVAPSLLRRVRRTFW